MPIPATKLVMFNSFSPHWLNFERKRFVAAALAGSWLVPEQVWKERQHMFVLYQTELI